MTTEAGSVLSRGDDVPGVRRVVVYRPETKNALDAATYLSLTDALRSADADADVRAIVLSGAGGTFSSGNDLGDFLVDGAEPDPAPVLGFLRMLVLCETPIVAAVEGHAIGVGATILLHCDLAVSGQSASFALPFVPLGLSPEGGSSYLLSRVAGTKLANELLLLGEPFGAQTAVRAGFINRVVDDGDAVTVATELASRLAQQPRESVRAARQLLRGDRERLLEVIDTEARIFLERLTSPETQQALARLARRDR